MIRKISLESSESVMAIISLQKQSYLLEARLISSHDIPPLRETFEELGKSEETFYGFYNDADALVGLVSYKVNEGILDIHRLAVSPDFLRKGIGTSLLEYAEMISQASRCVVCTGRDNSPAVNLYRKCGYVPEREFQAGNGIWLLELVKNLS